MALPDDVQLDSCLSKAAHGDAEAFGQVVEQLHWPLRLWLAARCPPEIDPDEIAHLAFVHAHGLVQDYQPGTSPRAWLWTIARNQMRAQITALRRRQAQTEQYLPEALRQALERSERDTADHDDRTVEALRACLTQLPSRYREMVDAHYRDDASLTALAERWQRTTGAVKKQLCLIRKSLRQCIEQRLAQLRHD